MNIINWKLLFGLRIVLTLAPQTGYVHPDEFFQSIEVFAGDIFNLDIHKPWEFNTTLTDRPLRSVTVPFITVGLPLLLLRLLSSWIRLLLGLSTVSPYTLLMFPRLCAAFLSLIADMCLYRVCRLYLKNHVKCLMTYASSYIMLVHMTRTLSNAVEATLFAMLLLVVSTCMHDMDKKAERGSKSDCQNSSRCNRIALLLTVGVFNRLTFIIYAFVPVIIWILYGHSITLRNGQQFFLRIWSLVPGILATSALLILCDTLYYRPEHFTSNVQSLLEVPWVVTPLNFMLYNTNRTNLEQHGLHPPYVHILVNVPMLFGVLGIFALLQYLKLNFTYVSRHRWTMPAIDKLFHCSFMVPLLLLSVIPHQEPRFIIALLFPLAFLHGEWLWGRGKIIRVVQALWILGNSLGCLFFGFLHQGGVVSSLFHLQNIPSGLKGAQVIYYHTYMPPRSLLLGHKDSACQDLHIHDIMGGSLQDLLSEIRGLQNSSDIFVVSPSSLRKSVVSVLRSYGGTLNTTFPMHISMEDPPPLDRSFFSHLGLDLHTRFKTA